MELLPKPLFMKFLDKYPKTWKYLINVGLLIKYKTIHRDRIPNKISLGTENSLYINSAENRGRALLLKNGETQTRLTSFWKEAVMNFKPTIVLDVGVNYGECIFSTNYDKEVKIYGFEANERLIPFIECSRDEHKNKEQIKIIHALASDQTKPKQSFYVNSMWSGTSSGVTRKMNKAIERQTIDSIKVDSLFTDHELLQERVLFKVDVEGFEAFVLNGMERLIQESKSCLGFIEFDSHYIRKSGTDIEDFLLFLEKHFEIYYYTSEDQLIKMDRVLIENFKDMLGTKEYHTDLVLMR
ncbi:FkbM family methyltransferase [Metabacillus litoralis]|uniref:FkbM family methyltransferase n=1 Tax=Metabacillus litoralis TaxID=152268 RepID=UPI00203C3D09|nr:FkbM family methyltransferase [Metabacillus litoralis]